MRSELTLIIDHGEDTDRLDEFATELLNYPDGDFAVVDYSVRVDIPVPAPTPPDWEYCERDCSHATLSLKQWRQAKMPTASHYLDCPIWKE